MFKVSNIDNQAIYINDKFLSGVQSLSLSYETNIEPQINISDTGLNYNIVQPIVVDMSLDYYLSDNDIFINYTGNSFFSGRIEYADKYITFTSGFLSNYSLDYSIDQPVLASVNATLYGYNSNATGYKVNRTQNINFAPTNYYADINYNLVDSNRLEKFSINITTDRLPNYEIGKFLPEYVSVKYPIKIDSSFIFSISDYIPYNPTNLFQNLITENAIINFKNYYTSQNILSFNLANLIKNNENLNFDVNSDGKLKINLSTYILSGG